jgi:hypothetical protein
VGGALFTSLLILAGNGIKGLKMDERGDSTSPVGLPYAASQVAADPGSTLAEYTSVHLHSVPQSFQLDANHLMLGN